MRRLFEIIIFRCSMVCLLLTTIPTPMSGIEISREITQYFSITTSAVTVEVVNKFGNVNIQTGDSDKVQIDATVTVESETEVIAQKVINSVNIHFENRGNKISAETLFHTISYPGNKSVEINYTVTVPKNTKLKVSQSFGNIILPEELACNGQYHVNFGTLQAGQLTGDNYISLSHSKCSINSAHDMKMSLDFSTVSIDNIHNIFSTSKLSYSNLSIGRLNAGFSEFTTEASFSDIALSFDKKASYRLSAVAQYGDISIAPSINLTNDKISGRRNYKSISGDVRSQKGKGMVNYRGNFSNLKLTAL